ncbi:MAG: hypothetical protein PHU33_16500 [Bacteroidales bacterium]|nr:hypothetical protein [Bacteroidales bacterium]
MADFLKNTEEYSWADIKVVMMGREVTGLKAVKYGAKRQKEPGYAAGSKPRFMGRGNYSYSVEITVLQSEVEAIIESAGGDPLDVPPFDIVVAYIPEVGLPMRTDVIKYAEFAEWEKASKQGDMFHEVTMPGVCLAIELNTVPN